MDPDEVEFAVEVDERPGRRDRPPRAASSTWPRRASCAPCSRRRPRAGAVTLDLAGLRFLDTSGLRLILETAEAARRGGVRRSPCCPASRP